MRISLLVHLRKLVHRLRWYYRSLKNFTLFLIAIFFSHMVTLNSVSTGYMGWLPRSVLYIAGNAEKAIETSVIAPTGDQALVCHLWKKYFRNESSSLKQSKCVPFSPQIRCVHYAVGLETPPYFSPNDQSDQRSLRLCLWQRNSSSHSGCTNMHE